MLITSTVIRCSRSRSRSDPDAQEISVNKRDENPCIYGAHILKEGDMQ